ncbi:MAG: SRPBCC family protein [Nitrososphaera sp.]|uniref:SRPBCC family protein n=1 Tax=Nitrososphaera sp. TaxID=1971748 RepID=UPI003D6FBB9C
MHAFRHAFTVDADIDRVWGFYTDVGHLEVVTPKRLKLKVERSTTGEKLQEGTELWISAQLVTRSTWHSRIIRLAPYTYVDEMLEGKFPHWKHTHVFRKTESGTEILDEIELLLPYGALGRMFEGYAGKQLSRIFKYRKDATINALR